MKPQRETLPWLTHKLDPGTEASHPSLFLNISLPTIYTVGAGFKDADLRKQDVIEGIWTEYMTEPS